VLHSKGPSLAAAEHWGYGLHSWDFGSEEEVETPEVAAEVAAEVEAEAGPGNAQGEGKEGHVCAAPVPDSARDKLSWAAAPVSD